MTPSDEDTPLVHRRTLDFAIRRDGRDLVVAGRLVDERPWQPDPHLQTLHDMRMELRVDRSFTITAAQVDMAAFPHAECPLVVARFADLVGLNVARGYSRALRGVFGGVTGCAHVYELARAAGSAIVQGGMSSAAHARSERAFEPELVKRALGGTCHVWSADGPGFAKLDLGWRPDNSEYPVRPVAEFDANAQ